MEHKTKVSEIIAKKQFEKLFKYNNFCIKEIINDKLIKKLLSCQKNDIIKYVVNNIIDLEFEDEDGWRFIHYIMAYSNSEIIKHIIDKGIDLECQTSDGGRPIHFACRYQNKDTIGYILKYNINMECETKNGWRPIHLISRYQNSDVIKFAISKNMRIDTKIRKFRNKETNYGVKELVLANVNNLEPKEILEIIELLDNKFKEI